MTKWQLLRRPTHSFPDQSKLRSAAMDAFDAFVPKDKTGNPDGKDLYALTDRLNPNKRNPLEDTRMMKHINELRATVIMDAMGSPMNESHLRGFDGPLFGLADVLGIDHTALDGLVVAMHTAVLEEIKQYRAQLFSYPRFGTAWQQAQGSMYL